MSNLKAPEPAPCSLQWRWRSESSAGAGEEAKGGVVWSKEGTGQPVPRTEGQRGVQSTALPFCRPGPTPVACEGWKSGGCI